MPATRYDDYDSGGQSYDNDDPEIIFTPYATIESEIGAVFGADGQYGQSLGVKYEEVEVIDGCLYVDPDKQKLKLFSWQEANDMTPLERLERDEEPSAEDASELIRKKYAGNTKEYELVGARVEPVVDDDGEVILEASSRVRDYEFTGGGVEFGEWENLGGDVIEISDVLSWYNGGDNGPSVTARTLAENLTTYGENAVTDEDDIFGWFRGANEGGNHLREDLEDRRLRFFIVTRTGEDYTYNLPIVEDVDTGEQIQPNNRSDEEGGSGNSDSAADDAVAAAEQRDAGDYPEPIADFLSSGTGLGLTEDRADTLLDDLISDDDNAMTAEMVEDYGGKSALIEQVV